MTQPAEQFADWWHDRTEGIGLATALKTRPVYQTTTPHHRIEVLAHDGLGWVLAIDGVLQGVQQDPCDREMCIHVPLLGKPRTRCRVLLLGGGDGALLHEVLRHPFVTEVVLCEPDTALIEVGKKYLGFGADLGDPRVQHRQLASGPALEYSRKHDIPFDLIVAWPTFVSSGFCHNLAACLAQDGVCVDSDRVVLGLNEVRWYRDTQLSGSTLVRAIQASSDFARVEAYQTTSQVSAGGYIGFFLYSRTACSYAEPACDFSGRCYNAQLHRAAFALPSFWDRLMSGGMHPC